MAEWHKVADPGDLEDGILFAVDIEGHEICIGMVCGKILAVQNECSHEDFPLNDGDFLGCELRCRYHGARFNPFTGEVKSLPAVLGIQTYPVEEREDGVYVQV